MQVGKGLSKDEKAQKLALQHWLEAVSSFVSSCQIYLFLCWSKKKLEKERKKDHIVYSYVHRFI